MLKGSSNPYTLVLCRYCCGLLLLVVSVLTHTECSFSPERADDSPATTWRHQVSFANRFPMSDFPVSNCLFSVALLFIYLLFVCLFFIFPNASAALHVHSSSEMAECLVASPLKPDLVNALEHLLRQRLNATHSNTLSLQHQHSSAANSLAIPHQTLHTQSFLRRSRCPNKQIHQKMTM